MGINVKDLRELVVRPTLEQLDEWSPAVENLLLGTAAQESQLGFIIHPGILKGAGLYRISEFTHTQVWDEFLVTNPELASRMRGLASQQQFLKSPHHELITNLGYATGIAWMIYKRNELPVLDENNVTALADCWQKNYSIRDPKQHKTSTYRETEINKFANNYRRLVLRENRKIAA